MRLNLWRLIGRLRLDEHGCLRYTVRFGDQKVAKEVRDWAGHGSQYRGQVKWSGRNAWYGLSIMGAPDRLVEMARECRGKPDPEQLHDIEIFLDLTNDIGRV